MFGSIERTDRIGPTFSGAAELKKPQKRVMPPSTTSSYTMSAWSRPDCGRASGVFSIFTPSDARVCETPSGSGSPVKGARTTGFVVVVVVASVVVVSDAPPPLLQAAAVSPTAATSAAVTNGALLTWLPGS